MNFDSNVATVSVWTSWQPVSGVSCYSGKGAVTEDGIVFQIEDALCNPLKASLLLLNGEPILVVVDGYEHWARLEVRGDAYSSQGCWVVVRLSTEY